MGGEIHNNQVEARNPDRPSSMPLVEHVPDIDDASEKKRRYQRMSSPERFEIQQMIAANVIDKSELPDFDEESGIIVREDDSDEDIEIELKEEEPPFLTGHGRVGVDLSPVKIVKVCKIVIRVNKEPHHGILCISKSLMCKFSYSCST